MTRPTLTFLHGFMGDPSDWELIRSELSEYPSVAPLIKPASDWSAGVSQLIDELPERSVLVGYSMGARLALAIALEHPQRCEALCFVSGNPGIEDDTERQKRIVGEGKLAERIATDPREEFLNFWYTQSSVFKTLTPRIREEEISRKLARKDDDWPATLKTYSVASQPNYWPRLGELGVPVMAVAGMQDKKYTNLILRMGQQENIESRIVESCGHILHHEQPYVFLELLKQFLASLDS